jgi:hypothetical protein
LFSSSVTFRKLLINDIRGTGDMTTVSLFWSVCSTTLIERCKGISNNQFQYAVFINC